MQGMVASSLRSFVIAVAGILASVPCIAESGEPPQLVAPTTQSGQLSIPIRFSLAHAGFVTLVIEDQNGKRVRNLISETPFPAGNHVAWWDGLDDGGRDTDAASHGQYHIPGKTVDPGRYLVRGLVRPDIRIVYELTPYSNGAPPWQTKDRSSEWLANHSAPSAVLFIPPGSISDPAGVRFESKGEVIVGSYFTEGGSGLAWLDLDGRKRWGQMWMGGNWTGATQLARDTGIHALKDVYAYAASSWHGDKYNGNIRELRLNALLSHPRAKPTDDRVGTGEDVPVLDQPYQIPGRSDASVSDVTGYPQTFDLTGLAVRDGLIVVAFGRLNQLLFIDAARRTILGTSSVQDPRGLSFDARGRLLVLSTHSILRFRVSETSPQALGKPDILVAAGLDDPRYMCADDNGTLYVSDWGRSHQVKVFNADGNFMRAIGHPGRPALGPYDPLHMNHPAGVTLDDRGHLWVAENDKMPKRISVWNPADGRLVNAFFGPSRYGGGGAVDSVDPARVFYADEGGGMEFRIDPTGKTSVPDAIYFRTETGDIGLTGKGTGTMPEYPIHRNGSLYLTNAHASEVGAPPSAMLWRMDKGVAHPVAAAGSTLDGAGKLLPAFSSPAMRQRMPTGVAPDRESLLFIWSDDNGNGRVDANEVQFLLPPSSGKNGPFVSGAGIGNDLSFTVANAGDVALRFEPIGFSAQGVPRYTIRHGDVLAQNVQRPASSGGGQVLVGKGGWTVLTTPPAPLRPQGVGGTRNGVPMWSYPSPWPGLHASHIAPLPEFPGELIGTTRVLGNPIDAPAPSDAGQLWGINGNEGQVYLFTIDGLFVATLFRDARTQLDPPPLRDMRGMDVASMSLLPESFHPVLTTTSDGQVYLQAGHTGSLFRLYGLAGIRRLRDATITITASQLANARHQAALDELSRAISATARPSVLEVERLPEGSVEPLSGRMRWPDDKTRWVTIDTRSVLVGSWARRKVDTDAALAISPEHLLIAVRTDNPALLENSGQALQNLFKTGGGIDLMLGADANAPRNRAHAVKSDERLLVARVQGKATAVLYRPVEPGSAGKSATFSSPLRTIRFDEVTDVSDQLQLTQDVEPSTTAGTKRFIYKLSVPLKTLHLVAPPGTSLKGDIGVLRGNGTETLQRSYWSNKATGLVSDVPSEAELTPNLWGDLRFVP
ncbi:hypothetical protein P4G95_29875 [Burkholderia vietnamiensis]|uniref:hypothetical protein n=1 Tax=Burkholderia vietnamiensis TaxID=60552 RepID=UPI0015936318|nr:hypothetical protein [Burkholderia vietnamiensis]WHU95949.1 hypothetical protein P4G95_29875 [Burkholderia vietnamiensis]